MVDRLEDLGVPTICRLNGGVYGGSTDLALACDFRIGVDTSEMFMPAARLGLHYYPSGIRRYVSRLGADNAKKLFLTAEKIGARGDAADRLSHRHGAAGGSDEEVDRLATLLAANAPVAMAGMKRTINEIARGKLDEAAADARARDSMRGRRSRKASAPAPRSARRSFDPALVRALHRLHSASVHDGRGQCRRTPSLYRRSNSTCDATSGRSGLAPARSVRDPHERGQCTVRPWRARCDSCSPGRDRDSRTRCRTPRGGRRRCRSAYGQCRAPRQRGLRDGAKAERLRRQHEGVDVERRSRPHHRRRALRRW